MPHRFALCDCNVKGYSKLVQLELWKNAPDFKTLFNLNKIYILCDLTIHPAHGIPLYSESASLKRRLIELNEHGLFTFQGQPRTDSTGEDKATIKVPHRHDQARIPVEPVSEFMAFCRTCSGPKPCWGDCNKFSMTRQLPYIQFCIPVESPGTATFVHAYQLAEALCKDDRVHTMVSWPKDLHIFCDSIERFDIPWVGSDLTEAARYIPEQDHAGHHHFKSKHGSSCAHEVKNANSEDALAKAKWTPAQGGKWSEVNDFHLLRPRVPDYFLGPRSKTVVFGVNAVDYEGGIEDIEAFVLKKAEDAEEEYEGSGDEHSSKEEESSEGDESSDQSYEADNEK